MVKAPTFWVLHPWFSPELKPSKVKFPCGLGIAVQHGRGNLAALWPLGKPRRLPTQRETRGKLVPVQVEQGKPWEKC